MNRIAPTINSLWHLSGLPGSHRFQTQIKNSRRIQETILLRILKRNQNSSFGQKYQFNQIKDVVTYQKQIPIRPYEDFFPWIERIKLGEENVLTSEKVECLVPTGGSSGGSKLIPYTASLKREFNAGINPWVVDLFRQFPQIKNGTSYWSVTPALTQSKSQTPVAVGFENDTEYLGWLGSLMERTLAVPIGIKNVTELENFRYLTAYFLLISEDLTLTSVWNPTFLTLLLDTMEKFAPQLIRDVSNGRITLPIPQEKGWLKGRSQPAPRRAKFLEKIFSDNPVDYSQVWPKLVLVSCWMDGPSAYYTEELKKKMPGILFQGKGLLATEGIVSLPWEGQNFVPAYQSHFLEFIRTRDDCPCLVDELKENETYRVVITTGGGLYRYDLQDQILVAGQWKGLPLIQFIGRNRVSDYVGEKLSYVHAEKVIGDFLQRYHLEPKFIMLAPQRNPDGVYYTLFIETKPDLNPWEWAEKIQFLENGLKQNFHYQYARDLGQILPLKIFLIEKDGQQSYVNRCLSEGQRLGDIKNSFLDRRSDWLEHFEGAYLDSSITFTTNHTKEK